MAECKEPKIRVQKPENSGSRCVVPNCSNRQGVDKVQGIKRSYYRFPKGENKAKLRRLWKDRVRRVVVSEERNANVDWKASDSDRICSDHFVGGKFVND